jgi:hypothetical protein
MSKAFIHFNSVEGPAMVLKSRIIAVLQRKSEEGPLVQIWVGTEKEEVFNAISSFDFIARQFDDDNLLDSEPLERLYAHGIKVEHE